MAWAMPTFRRFAFALPACDKPRCTQAAALARISQGRHYAVSVDDKLSAAIYYSACTRFLGTRRFIGLRDIFGQHKYILLLRVISPGILYIDERLVSMRAIFIFASRIMPPIRFDLSPFLSASYKLLRIFSANDWAT